MAGDDAPRRHALLVVERVADDSWSFAFRHRTVGAGDGENLLFARATSAMPERGVVIGWQLADAVVEPLLGATREGDPDTAAAFLARFLNLVTAPSVDLAIAHGGAGAPPPAAVLVPCGIDIPRATPAQIESAWAFGNTGWLCEQADAETIAAWRLWLAEANGIAADVSRHFERWWSDHTR